MKVHIRRLCRTHGLAAALTGAAGFASLLAGCAATAQTPAPPPTAIAPPSPEAVIKGLVDFEVKLGPDEWRLPRLANSPRKHAELAVPGLGVTQRAFIVYPDKPGPASVVLLLPEDQGLNTWARSMADQIAAMGHIVIAVDFLAGRMPTGAGRESLTDLKSVFGAFSGLSRKQPELTAQASFWADYGKALPQFNGKLAVVGTAWGGGRAAWLSTARSDLNLVAIFYDWIPPALPYEEIKAPIHAFIAEDDPRVTASLERTRSAMKRLGKPYEEVIYPGSEHMFVRLGEEPRDDNPANIEARHAALARLQRILTAM